jgi:hypothetical protein
MKHMKLPANIIVNSKKNPEYLPLEQESDKNF